MNTARIRAASTMLHHTLVLMAGHRYWLLPFATLGWLLFMFLIRLLNPLDTPYSGPNAQGALIGVPLTALAVFLGMRIIAGEIDNRSLEIAYTVPGGCERLWLIKLASAFGLLVATEGLLALAVYFLFTHFPPGILYGALQAACFYLVLANGMATLFRGEAAGAIATSAILALNALITDFGNSQIRISPFFNPYYLEQAAERSLGAAGPTELVAWTLQNRVGVALAIAAILGLTFMRANRRERMLEEI